MDFLFFFSFYLSFSFFHSASIRRKRNALASKFRSRPREQLSRPALRENYFPFRQSAKTPTVPLRAFRGVRSDTGKRNCRTSSRRREHRRSFVESRGIEWRADQSRDREIETKPSRTRRDPLLFPPPPTCPPISPRSCDRRTIVGRTIAGPPRSVSELRCPIRYMAGLVSLRRRHRTQLEIRRQPEINARH